jgi:hypothetical protein
VGTITYKGRKIKFDRKYLEQLVKSFKSKAFDQVPFMLAKDDNAHTMDPDRFRGEVKGIEMTDDGIDVLLELTDDAADLVRENPRLGVSARIVEGLERADGKHFAHAVQHVLGTLDPRVTGMSGWKEVEELSYAAHNVIDLTNGVTWDLLDGEIDEDDDDEPVNDRIFELETQLAEERYTSEYRRWVDKGVPPAIVSLARPILEMPEGCVVDLSNGEGEVDVAQVIRDMLDETTGFIDLATERGHTYDGKDLEDADAFPSHVDFLLDAWAKDTK